MQAHINGLTHPSTTPQIPSTTHRNLTIQKRKLGHLTFT